MLGLNALAAGAGLAMPLLLGVLIDSVGAGEGADRVDQLAMALFGCALAQFVFTRFAFQAGFRFGERNIALLREGFVDRALRLPAPVVERAGTGDLTTRTTTDVATIGRSLRDALPEVTLATVELVVLFALLFFLHPLLGLCGALGLPVLLLVSRWYLRRARTAYLAEGAANSELAESLATTAEGARTAEAFGLQNRRRQDGERRVREAHRARSHTLNLRSVLFPVADFAHALPMAAMLLVGGVLVGEGWTTLGAVAAACLYTVRIVEPLDVILSQLETLQGGLASLARIKGVEQAGVEGGPADTVVPPSRQEAAGRPRESQGPDGARGLDGARAPSGGLLEVRGVDYAYHAGREVLRGVELTVRPGERLAVVGPSGSGKSTLARLLAGIAEPGRGAVTLEGVPVASLPPEERRRRVVLVTQEYHVFRESLRFNLALAAPGAEDSELESALAVVGARWALELPEGLDSRLGADAVELDAAQAQQVALARVVLADPHTVILDEATAMLDPTTARQTERSFAAVLAGRTVIAIAHRLQTAHDADRVAVMEAGRIVELGSHHDLLATEGAYAGLWRSWHGGG